MRHPTASQSRIPSSNLSPQSEPIISQEIQEVLSPYDTIGPFHSNSISNFRTTIPRRSRHTSLNIRNPGFILPFANCIANLENCQDPTNIKQRGTGFLNTSVDSTQDATTTSTTKSTRNSTMSAQTPTRRSTRTKQPSRITSLSANLAPSTSRQSRKRSIGKVDTADEFVDLSGSDDERTMAGTSGVNEVTGMLTPPPTKEREKKRRNVAALTITRG